MLLLCGPLTEQPAADFTNVRVPFYKSIRVTAQLPQAPLRNCLCDYLRDVYCIDKQWLELKLKESKRSNT